VRIKARIEPQRPQSTRRTATERKEVKTEVRIEVIARMRREVRRKVGVEARFVR
jgi:hypothetical protein